MENVQRIKKVLKFSINDFFITFIIASNLMNNKCKFNIKIFVYILLLIRKSVHFLAILSLIMRVRREKGVNRENR